MNSVHKGTINLEEVVILPNVSTNTALYLPSEELNYQLYSADLNTEISYQVEISLDGNYWAIAKNVDGEDITGTLTPEEADIGLLSGLKGTLCRLKFIRTAETGNIQYLFKSIDV